LCFLEYPVCKIVCCTDPDASDDGLFDPSLIFPPEESNFDQIVNDFACGGIAVTLSTGTFNRSAELTYALSACEYDA
jgi:hypothetical protein